MEGACEMANLKVMNQDLVKLDSFDGTNFTCGKKKNEVLTHNLEDLLRVGSKFDANFWIEWWNQGTKDEMRRRWTHVIGSTSWTLFHIVSMTFHSCFLLKGLNNNFLTLLPKIAIPEEVSHFRPFYVMLRIR